MFGDTKRRIEPRHKRCKGVNSSAKERGGKGARQADCGEKKDVQAKTIKTKK